ncbi:MAG: S1 RNA-binding domain-containing protein, partial [Quinella sp. 2Q5]|nr:S1 RNA-binding domain-containing protein [Quinella sp. 2Q5]
MVMEAGSIVEGKVTRITNFGAFVELGDGKVGLVHISEVADVYVNDVRDFLSEGDTVRVKVINVDGNKIALSLKQAKPRPPEQDG